MMPRVKTPKVYDRAYFDRWYRDPRHAIVRGGMLERRVQLAVAAAEFVLERPIRSVLDVGCGEAPWRALLLRARPGIRYVGVDSSEYVLRRFGKSRGIRPGRFADLDRLRVGGPFDLIVCADVLHYLKTPELKHGLGSLVRRLRGLAYLEVYASDDSTVGDEVDYQRRSSAAYRRLFHAAGLRHVGLHGWVTRRRADTLLAFERAR
jgi:SAM-dependent methyltransferase